MIVVVSGEAVGPDAGEGEPWGRYWRDRLASGWTYVLGRDAIEGGLRQAGARVDDLSMHLPFGYSSGPGVGVVEVHCNGDSRSGLGSPHEDPHRVAMWWWAVPVEVKALIAQEVAGLWLARACAWAAAVPGRGNAWSASDHRWALRYEAERGLYVVEE